MPFQEGEQVGSYRIIEQLGRGGMATVFKAYHASLDRYVAVKVLHPAFMEDETFLARFEREAKVVAKLEHPNIIPIYDFSEHNGHPFLVMKYVEGKTLKARLKQAPLTPEEGVEIIQAVGDGLAYAHQQGILHRDIKPSNVMISTDGQIYLTDFGLARIASAGESTLSSDMIIGTPQYISPEQAMGKRDLDAGTDIYSFGVLIYELVVGRVPFNADTPFSIVHDHIYTPLPMPKAVNPNVPEVIERLLLKALAKERADRFETVEEMVAAFRQAIRGEDLEQVWVDPDTYTPTQTPRPVPLSGQQTAAQIGPGSAPISDSSAARKSPPKWRWWYSIPLGMLLCVCLLLVIGALSDRPEETLPAPLLTNAQEDDDIDGGELSPEDQAILEAERWVADNPEDPYAYLDLASLYLDAGDTELAFQTYAKGVDTAGENADYYLTAGDMLTSRAYWVKGLEQYTNAIELDPGLITSANVPKFQKALYYAAANSEAQSLLLGLDAETFPQAIGQDSLYAAQARFNLLVLNQPDTGLALIVDTLTQEPDSPMALLVRAEIFMAMDRTDDARDSLEELIDGDGIPSWVQNEARTLLSQLN